MGASPEADRRPVTVLFADLAGFTALAERLDPEDVRALQTDLFDAMRGALEPLGAFIEKFVGDAVVAVFGAPQAHEDDPQRAMRAALARARAADRSSVVVIDTDPLKTTEAGGWWWDVAVPEVSDRPEVNAARRDYEQRIRMKRNLS